MAKDTRFERVTLFEQFNTDSFLKNTFEKFKSMSDKYQKFDDYHMLCVCPKGRNGGVDKRIAEVFYGACPYDSTTKINGHFDAKTETLREYGTTLAFHLNDHGYIAIMLHPSRTEYTKSFESTIFVENYIHPKKLLSESFLKRQWFFFNSYMECTSIEGNPDWMDKLRVFYLRNFKNYVIDQKYENSKIWNYTKGVFDWVFKVGLSGLLIYFLTVFPSINNKIENIQTVNSDTIKIELKEIRKMLHDCMIQHRQHNKSDSVDITVPSK